MRRTMASWLGVCGGLLALASTAVAGEARLPVEGHAVNPSWSVDGRRLAVEVNDMANRVDLFVLPVNGGAPGSATAVALPGADAAFGTQKSIATTPVWHPEVLVLTGAVGGRDFRVFFTPPAGGKASEMIGRSTMDGSITFPAISPAGDRMAFISSRSGAGDVSLYERASGTVKTIVKSATPEAFPSFSPDGKRLYFTRRQADREEIISVPAGGGSETVFATGKGSRTRPVEAKGGMVVYFQSASGDASWNLAVKSAGGSEKILMRDVALPERAQPALSPDGAWVFYGVTDPIAATMLYAINVETGKTAVIPTNLVGAREPAVTRQGDKMLLAFTALPQEGADWRGLHIMDISSKL